MDELLNVVEDDLESVGAWRKKMFTLFIAGMQQNLQNEPTIASTNHQTTEKSNNDEQKAQKKTNGQ